MNALPISLQSFLRGPLLVGVVVVILVFGAWQAFVSAQEGPKKMPAELAALDAQTRIILQDELLRIWGQDRPAKERRTVVFITHGIDEAVFLADRVAVMGPGNLKEIIEIDLPRPRGDATRVLPAFQALTQRIWGLIRAEAYRAIT